MRLNSEDILETILRIIAVAILVLIVSTLAWKTFATGPLMKLREGTMTVKPMKISYKGLIWKTWEGWVPIGVSDEGGIQKWKFTAETEEVAECIQNNEKVKLYYVDYIWMPFRKGQSHQVYKCEPIQ